MIVRDGISNEIDMLSNDNKMLLGVCWLVNIDSLAWCKVSYIVSYIASYIVSYILAYILAYMISLMGSIYFIACLFGMGGKG